MTRQVLNRLAGDAAGRAPLPRCMCEARKLGGRVRTAAVTPAWDRAIVRVVLERLRRRMTVARLAGDSQRASNVDRLRVRHIAHSGAHFVSRRRSVPGQRSRRSRQLVNGDPARLPRRASRLPLPRRADARRAATTCSAIVACRSVRARTGTPMPVHGRRSPLAYWADVPYLDPADGRPQDHLGTEPASALADLGPGLCAVGRSPLLPARSSPSSRAGCDANPPLLGTNWASMLELAFRRSGVALGARAVRGGRGSRRRGRRGSSICSSALDRQLTHIEQNLSHYFSPNTHLSGEALALYVAGCALPELTASAAARRARTAGADPGGGPAGARRRRPRGAVGALPPLFDRLLPARGACRQARRRPGRDGIRGSSTRPGAIPARDLRRRAASGRSSATTTAGSCFRCAGRPADDCRPTLATAAVLLQDAELAHRTGAGGGILAVRRTRGAPSARTTRCTRRRRR